MRKVTLSMEAQEKYEIIKRLAEGHITKTTAAVKIGCTPDISPRQTHETNS